MIRRLCVIALLAAALASCNTITKAPEVSLAGIDVIEFGLLEQRFGLQLRLLNPNDSDISIDGLSYELEVNGQAFAKGVSNKSARVPRFGEAVLEVSAVSNLGALMRQLAELQRLGRDSVTYRLKGQFNSGAAVGVPFDHSGEVKLPNLSGGQRQRSGERT